MLTEYVRGWLSALIDGEGSLTLACHRARGSNMGWWRPLLDIGNTNLDLLKTAQRLIGAGNISYHRGKLNHKDWYLLEVTSGGLRVVLPQLGLIVKEKQRLLLIEALKLLENKHGRDRRDERLSEIWTEMKCLNRKGRP